MNGRTLAVFVIVGIAVAGYAVYTLSRPRSVDDPIAAEERAPTPDAGEDGRRGGVVRDPVEDAKADAPQRRPPIPAAPPEPEESEEAKRLRKELSELFDHLDAVHARDDKLPQQEWQEAYMKGNADISSLATELGSNPNAVDEIEEYYGDLRHKLADVEEVPQ